MAMADLDIHEPGDLAEAFRLLRAPDGAARPMGGGTALMLMMKAQLFKPSALVSLAKVDPRFHGVELSADGASFSIGAMTTFAELEHHADLCARFPVIAQTMVTLANPRVRNVATIGGNLAHADPHLDLPPVWASLDAEVSVIGPQGERRFPVIDLFAGYYETTLQPGELIMRLHAPVQQGWRRRYVKVTTRSAHDWPAIGIAIGVNMNSAQCEDLRLILSAATDRPTRLVEAEAILRGQTITDDLLAAAGAAAASEVHIETDSRGSSDYKAHLLSVHLKRALHDLCE